MESIFRKGEQTDSWIPVDVSFIKEFWLPDAEILNLKEFKTLDVLSKLEGLPLIIMLLLLAIVVTDCSCRFISNFLTIMKMKLNF